MRIRILFIIALVFSALQFANAQPATKPAWNPQKTWVFMVGLVEWKDQEEFEPFPQEGRQDTVLLDLLKQRGVPEKQIVYLKDSQATSARIVSEFTRTLAKTRAGDWIFVYFEGHGYKDDADAETFLASYDASDDIDGWPVNSIPDAIERNFNGSHAMIALDNCYSGAMAEAVKAGRRRVSYAVMASSLSSQTSTGNWTFTEALVSGFRGAPHIDDNEDGKVTFFEMGENAREDMLFGEEQVATISFTGRFDPQTVIAEAPVKTSTRVGERVEVYSVDDWYKGYIVDAMGGKFKIHYFGYDETEDEWVTARMIRQPKITRYAVGQKVEVEWKKEWYPATVVLVKGGSHYITYTGYGKEWNEWVSSKRIRRTK
jgi:hypothetical protein